MNRSKSNNFHLECSIWKDLSKHDPDCLYNDLFCKAAARIPPERHFYGRKRLIEEILALASEILKERDEI